MKILLMYPAFSTDPIYSHIVIRNDIYVNKCKVMIYQCFKFGEVLVKAQLMFGTGESNPQHTTIGVIISYLSISKSQLNYFIW